MKYLGALVVFILALGFNLKSVASDAAHADAAVCTAESAKDHSCTPAAGEKHEAHVAAGNHNAAKDWSHKRQEQISAIFPTKQKTDGLNIHPENVKLTSPKLLAKVSASTVKLEWKEAAGANHYHIQISKDAGFNNRSMYVTENKNVTGTTFEVKDLEPGVKYFWRVAAVNMEQESQYTKSAFASSAFETENK